MYILNMKNNSQKLRLISYTVFLIILMCSFESSHAFGMLPDIAGLGQSVLERIQGFASSFFQIFNLRASTSPRSTSTSAEATTASPNAVQSTQTPIRVRQQRQQQRQAQQQRLAQLQQQVTFRPFQQQQQQQQELFQLVQVPQKEQTLPNLVSFTTAKPLQQQQQQKQNFNTNFQVSSINNASFGTAQSRTQEDDDIDLEYEVKRLNGLLS